MPCAPACVRSRSLACWPTARLRSACRSRSCTNTRPWRGDRRASWVLTHADVDAVADFVCAQAHHRKIFYLWRPFLRDPNDDMVLEVAVEAQCGYIATFNTRDSAGVEQFGLQTLTPGEFLALLQEDA